MLPLDVTVTDGGAPAATTPAVTVYVFDSPGKMLPRLHGSGPGPPTHPLVDPSVSPAVVCTSDCTFRASTAPLLVTVTVNTTVLPAVVGEYPPVLTVVTTSASPTVVVSVCWLFPGTKSVVVLVAVAVL